MTNFGLKLNRIVFFILGPFLAIIGTAGFLVPATSLSSTAPWYNILHIFMGLTGFAIFISGSTKQMVQFNFGVGAVDFYQYIASKLDLFPKNQFQWKAVDVWAHLFMGVGLLVIGYTGMIQRPLKVKAED